MEAFRSQVIELLSLILLVDSNYGQKHMQQSDYNSIRSKNVNHLRAKVMEAMKGR